MDYRSLFGYRKDSPYRNNPYNDIYTDNGMIDMSMTDMDLIGIDEKGNKQVMKAGRKKPYRFPGKVIREIPYQQGGWHRQWLQSPMAKKMNQGEEDFTQQRLQALDELGDPIAVNPSFIASKSGKKSGNLGMYDNIDHKLYYNRKINNPVLLDKVINHEISHGADRGGKLMSKEDLNLTDSEGRALLNQARYQYQNDGIYNPFTQEFKGEYLNNKNDGIRNLRKMYTDEEIINLMNSVSSNNPYSNPVAQKGGLSRSDIYKFVFEDESEFDDNDKEGNEDMPTAPSTEETPSVGQQYPSQYYKGSVPANYSKRNNSNSKYAYDFFLKQGLQPHQAAGVVANLIQESGNFRDDVISGEVTGDNNLKDKAYGIAQWRGSRHQGLIDFAKRNGINPYSLDTQLAYVATEVRQRGDWDKLTKTKTLEEATHSFNYNYEVSADSRNPKLRTYRTRHVLDKNGNLIFR